MANIYDASKIKDQNYWKDIKSKDESCNAENANADSAGCGNCNYLGGSICQKESVGENARYGDYICKDLSCEFKREKFQHGETWCADTDSTKVGSNYYRYVCFNGDVTVEACDQFKNKVCIQDEVNGFRSAACRENKWQDCYSQKTKLACENVDARDCKWISDAAPLTGGERKFGKGEGACVPDIAPGLAFWQPGDAQGICSLGNAKCVVTFEKTTLGEKKCIDNCECLEKAWKESMNEVCISLGDCGNKENWVGAEGYTQGYKIGKEKVSDDSSSGDSSTGTQRISGADNTGRIQGAGGTITGWITKWFV